ncbi:hypothetical protein BY996DRAFT_6496868 [Phakopsora pachyrhizi]|uniref:Uncharacterized protein n=1 Tax=Phakopsora pachyrhizi TaxID=170000 RepID=A0AAV0AYW1_PHAPC|nr:hypothetical protein BY996DRAFT_6496868 [Phakopsora pachyrhizi]CAH7675693.1 hypothetical protein PPACK8108_LOCUS10719 [Phakopsora pachyrhizi]
MVYEVRPETGRPSLQRCKFAKVPRIRQGKLYKCVDTEEARLASKTELRNPKPGLLTEAVVLWEMPKSPIELGGPSICNESAA